MDIVCAVNNSNSVCFVGNYVHLRTFLWELITPRVIWKTSPSARFSNHPGRDQLSQVGSQMNIIASKHTLLYN